MQKLIFMSSSTVNDIHEWIIVKFVLLSMHDFWSHESTVLLILLKLLKFNVLFFYSIVDIWTLTFTPDSEHIATGSHGGKINLFSVETGTKINSFDTRGKFILSTACVKLIN